MDRVIEELIKMGKITYDDVTHAESMIVDDNLTKATDIIHSILCNKPHLQPGEIDIDGCLYYVEEQMDDTWYREGHLYWLSSTREIMNDYKITSSDVFLEKLISAIKFSEEFARLDKLTKRIFTDYVAALGIDY